MILPFFLRFATKAAKPSDRAYALMLWRCHPGRCPGLGGAAPSGRVRQGLLPSLQGGAGGGAPLPRSCHNFS